MNSLYTLHRMALFCIYCCFSPCHPLSVPCTRQESVPPAPLLPTRFYYLLVFFFVFHPTPSLLSPYLSKTDRLVATLLSRNSLVLSSPCQTILHQVLLSFHIPFQTPFLLSIHSSLFLQTPFLYLPPRLHFPISLIILFYCNSYNYITHFIMRKNK